MKNSKFFRYFHPTYTRGLKGLLLNLSSLGTAFLILVGIGASLAGTQAKAPNAIPNPPPPPAQTNSPNQVLYYSFDELSGGGNILSDLSGNGRDGRLINFPASPSPLVPGLFSNALSFTSQSTISVTPDRTLDLRNGFTLSLWYRSGKNSPSSGSASLAHWMGAYAEGWELVVDDHGIPQLIFTKRGGDVQVCGGGNDNPFAFRSVLLRLNPPGSASFNPLLMMPSPISQRIEDGAWHHLAATFETTTGRANLMVDGAIHATGVITNYIPSFVAFFNLGGSSSSVLPSSSPVTQIPSSSGSSQSGFFLDEAKIFNRALTPSQATSLGSPPSSSASSLSSIGDPTVATNTPVYEVTDLGTGYATGINNLGQITGVSSPSGACIWTNGVISSIGTLEGYSIWPYAINDSTQVTGTGDSTVFFIFTHGFFWSPSQGMVDMGSIYGLGFWNQSASYDLNNFGQAVGWTVNTQRKFVAALWQNGAWTNLEPSGSNGIEFSWASGINNQGQICANALQGRDEYGYLVSGGNWTGFGSAETFPWRINDHTQITGWSVTANGAYHAFLWDNGTMTDLGTLGGYSFAYGINNQADIVGRFDFSSGGTHAFLWQTNVMTDLNQLISTNSSWVLNVATGINDNGQIVGYGANSNGQTRAFLLTPAQKLIAVDANRDGEIKFDGSDSTMATTPFRFWLNDDHQPTIHNQAELENFTRVQIKAPMSFDPTDPNFEVKVQFVETSGSPNIRLWQVPDTSTGYLTSTNAASQLVGNSPLLTISSASMEQVVSNNFFDASTKIAPLLFDATATGKAALQVRVLKSGNEVAKDKVYLDVKPVTEMYSRARAQPVSGINNPYTYFPQQPPASPVTGYTDETSSNFQKPGYENNQCVLFAHGWNVTEARYTQQSSEGFKRLWHAGFKGRFAALRWPSNLAGDHTPSLLRLLINAVNYFEIEYRAFKYATAVKQYVDFLSSPAGGGFQSIGLIGHSMGNILASETMLQGALASQYVVLNGAVSAGCYDVNNLLTQNTTLPGHPPASPPAFTVPDLTSPYGGYRGYFSGLSGLANFYNVKDDAMHAWVQGNNQKRSQYSTHQPGKPVYFFEPGMGMMLTFTPNPPKSPPPKPRPAGPPVGQKHESMAMFAESRTRPVGAEPRTAGAIGSNPVNLNDFFGANNAEHSAVFDDAIQNNEIDCWQKIMDTLFP